MAAASGITSGAYSFTDVQCAISGPGGNITIGADAGASEEGITFAMLDAKGTLTMGADGGWMHSLHASKGGRVEVRLLKTSFVNHLLSVMYNFQQTSAAYWGQNNISLKNPVTGDSMTAQGVSFEKLPDNVNAKDGGVMVWAFLAGQIDQIIGTYQPIPVPAS